MPHDSTPAGPQDLGHPLVSAGTSRGNLRGFDEEWQGIVDYIVGITHRIVWIGHHGGDGLYGPPSGRPITLLGISHHELLGDRIVREDSSYDLFALLKQLRGPERSTGGSDHADL